MYWSVQNGANPIQSSLGGSVHVDGTSPQLFTLSGLFASQRVAADSSGAYVMTSRGIVPFGGGTLLTGGTYAMALDSSYVYWSGTYTGVGSIGRTARDNSSNTVLANNLNNPMGIAVDGTNVYWVDEGAGTVMSVPLAGGAPKTLASGQNKPWAIAVDATGIYWTNNGDGTVRVLAK